MAKRLLFLFGLLLFNSAEIVYAQDNNAGTLTGWGTVGLLPEDNYGFEQIAAGRLHILTLREDGTVVAWGSNSNGQSTVPVWLSDVTAIAAGSDHSLALGSGGNVIAWGDDSYGQSTVPEELDDVVAIAAGSSYRNSHSLALREDGTVVAWGDDSYGQSTVPEGLDDVIAIDAGSLHNLALSENGTVTAWGDNSYGQTTVPAELSDVVEIAAGRYHSLALREDGTVVAWGRIIHGQVTVPNGLDNLVAIAAGGSHSLALSKNGTVVAWGNNFYGQSTVPDGLENVVAIAAGRHYSLALREDGAVVTWGSSYGGQSVVPVELGNVVAIATSGNHNLALSENGTVTAWGKNSYGQSTVPDRLENVMAIAAGGSHSLALRKDGTVVAWGGIYNDDKTVLDNVTAIAAGVYLYLALREDSTVVCLICNQNRQNTVPDELVDVTAIAAGMDHGLALREDGRVVAWGENSYGQSTVPDGLENVVAIAAGRNHSLALREDGRVVAWGYNTYRQSTVPDGLKDVVAIAAGSSHSLALREDGTVVAWGLNYNGQSEVPNGLRDVTAITAGKNKSFAIIGNIRNGDEETTITSIDPNPVTGSNSDQPIIVTGTGFEEGAFVILDDLDDDQGPFFNPEKTTFIDSTKLERKAYFTENAATWSAQVENPDGSRSDTVKFEVQAPLATNIELTDVYVKPDGEGSFTRYLPSEVSGVLAGAEIRFAGTVTDADSNPVSNQQVEAYNSFLYAPNDNEDGILTITTNNDGTFKYPAGGGSIATATTPAGVRPFWFYAIGTGEAVPFALYIHTSDGTLEKMNQMLADEVIASEVIRSMSIDTSASSPFSDLIVRGRPYPPDDTDLGSSANNEFFRYYYINYGGPTEKDFLLSENQALGWLRRGFDLHKNRVDQVLYNLPERFEEVFPPALSNGATREAAMQKSNARIDLGQWANVASMVGKYAACGAGIGAAIGTSGVAAGAVTLCVPVIGDLSGATFGAMINNSDLLRSSLCPGGQSIETCEKRAAFGIFLGEFAVGQFHSTELFGTLSRVHSMAGSIGDLHEVTSFYDASLIRNEQGQFRGVNIGADNAFDSGSWRFGVTRPERPSLEFNTVPQFDDPQNPYSLNITVESSRAIYDPGTTAQSTPAVQIGESSFSMERIEGDRANKAGENATFSYRTEIPVSRLPGYTGDPNRWEETIIVTGTSFETLQGTGTGAFCGIEDKMLTLGQIRNNIPAGSQLNASMDAAANAQGRTALEVPADAFGGQTAFVDLSRISYNQVSHSEQPTLRAASSVVKVSAGRSFHKSATLTLALNEANEVAEDASVYQRTDDSMWQEIDGTISRSDSTVRALIDESGYYAVLKDIGLSVSIEEPNGTQKPRRVILEKNYPNPFNPTTTIQYALPEATLVQLEVFNMLGQRVSVLVNEKKSAGMHTAIFNASNLSSGIYIYRLQAGEFVETRKLTLIK